MVRLYRGLVTFLALGAAVPLAAQQPEREPDRRRVEELQRSLEVAQRMLREALEQLGKAETEQTLRQLNEAMEQLRRAQLELRRSRVYGEMPEVRVFVGGEDYPQMGVYLQSVPNRNTDSIGAVLQSVVRGGPADEAGLRARDIITRADGQALVGERRPATKLVEIKNKLKVGDTLRVEYRRGSEVGKADLVLRRLEPPYATIETRAEVAPGRGVGLTPAFVGRAPFAIAAGGVPPGWLDVELISLDAELGRYFGISEGLLVVRAPRDESLPLKSGDVILGVDGRKPTDQPHLFRILRSYAPGETLRLEVMRDKKRTTLAVTVPERERGYYWP